MQAFDSSTREEALTYGAGTWRIGVVIVHVLSCLGFGLACFGGGLVFAFWSALLPGPETPLSLRPLVLLGGVFFGVVFLLLASRGAITASRHPHTVRLHADGGVDFISRRAQVRLPAHQLWSIWIADENEGLEVDDVWFRHRGGIIKGWRLDRVDELAERLRALNPALLVFHGNKERATLPSATPVCRVCQYPNVSDRSQCENCGARLPRRYSLPPDWPGG